MLNITPFGIPMASYGPYLPPPPKAYHSARGAKVESWVFFLLGHYRNCTIVHYSFYKCVHDNPSRIFSDQVSRVSLSVASPCDERAHRWIIEYRGVSKVVVLLFCFHVSTQWSLLTIWALNTLLSTNPQLLAFKGFWSIQVEQSFLKMKKEDLAYP